MAGRNLVQSLSRGLKIVELVAKAEDGLTLQQLADRLALKPPTVHGLAATLVAEGFLERASRPIRYLLGPKMITLVDEYRNRPLQRRTALAFGHLHAEYPSSRLVLAHPTGPDIVLSLRMGPERPGVLEQPGYSVMPSYTSATGLVFQAFWQHEQRKLNRQRYPFDEYGAHAWESEERLEEFLARVRADGYVLAPVRQTGLHRFAVPIFSATHDLFGALGLGLPMADDLDLDAVKSSLIPRLMEASEEIASGDRDIEAGG